MLAPPRLRSSSYASEAPDRARYRRERATARHGAGAQQRAAAVAEAQVRDFEAQAEEQELVGLAEEFPYLAEVVAGHVAKVGYDFTTAFEYGLDLILEALEGRRAAE